VTDDMTDEVTNLLMNGTLERIWRTPNRGAEAAGALRRALEEDEEVAGA